MTSSIQENLKSILEKIEAAKKNSADLSRKLSENDNQRYLKYKEFVEYFAAEQRSDISCRVQDKTNRGYNRSL